MLYLRQTKCRLALKLFRGEPAISEFDWNFSPTHTSSVRLEFLPYPHLIATLFNGCACGPPKPFTAPSSWTWVDHPVSGLRCVTFRPFQTWFPFGCRRPRLSPCRASQLAGPFYKKYAVALLHVVLPPVVDTGFQVLFHSPPGVLFTFPSRYCSLSVTG